MFKYVPVMMRQYLLFGGVSGGLSAFLFFFLIEPDFTKALLTGIMACPAGFLGILVLDSSRKQSTRHWLNHRYRLIHDVTRLEHQRQQDEQELGSLRIELGQLQIHIREKWQQKDELTRQLAAMAEHRHLLQRDYQTTKGDEFQQVDHQVQQRQPDQQPIGTGLRGQDNSDEYTSLEHYQSEIDKLRHQKDGLLLEISSLKLERHQLQQEVQHLETTVAQLHRVSQPSIEVPSPANPPEPQPNPTTPPVLPPEWTNFMVQLPEHEFMVLKAIVELENPTASIRRIAESQMTMPELLIDEINERSLSTVGDMILTPGAVGGGLAVSPEHLFWAKQVVITYEYLMH